MLLATATATAGFTAVTGGSPLVRRRRVRSVQATTVDVTPTVGEISGLRPPRGGYDGSSRL